MKRKEIGQCKDCKAYVECYDSAVYSGWCKSNNKGSNLMDVRRTFGCIYWKEKKK